MKRVSRLLSLCLVFIILSTSIVFGQTLDINDNIKGALLGDVETGEILYEYNIDNSIAIASITKLMTYTLLMDSVNAGKIKLDDTVTISAHTASTEGSSYYLNEGDVVKVSDLIDGMLVVSGNDAAVAIAELVGGTEENFVKMMNEKAQSLNLTTAKFINANGLPTDNVETDQNYMSVRDLFTLVRYILTNYPQITEVTKKTELFVPNSGYVKLATNPLLGVLEGVDGLKTGYTDKAGICLVSTLPVSGTKGQDEDYRLISIVMGAETHEDRVQKSSALLTYGRDNFVMKKLTDSEKEFETINIRSAKNEEVKVYAAKTVDKLVPVSDQVKTEAVYNEKIKAPLESNEKIGELNIYVGEEKIDTVDLVVKEEVKKANIFVRIVRFFKALFNK